MKEGSGGFLIWKAVSRVWEMEMEVEIPPSGAAFAANRAVESWH